MSILDLIARERGRRAEPAGCGRIIVGENEGSAVVEAKLAAEASKGYRMIIIRRIIKPTHTADAGAPLERDPSEVYQAATRIAALARSSDCPPDRAR
jgi:hypothetical protein